MSCSVNSPSDVLYDKVTASSRTKSGYDDHNPLNYTFSTRASRSMSVKVVVVVLLLLVVVVVVVVTYSKFARFHGYRWRI